jgi:centrosomal protein CEP164
VFDAELLWVAEQAIDADLPEEWEALEDDDGNEYYYNATTGTTSWDHPLEEHYRSLALQVRLTKVSHTCVKLL